MRWRQGWPRVTQGRRCWAGTRPRSAGVRAGRRARLAGPAGGGGPRPGLHACRPRPAAALLLGRRADPGLADPGAGGRARRPAVGRADQPPGHQRHRVAGGAPGLAGRRGLRVPRPLVPGVGRHRGARDRPWPRPLRQGQLLALAAAEGRAAGGAGRRVRAPAGRARAPAAVRRPLPVRHQGSPGPEQAQGNRPDRAHRPAHRAAGARLPLPPAAPQRPGRGRGRGARCRRRRPGR